MLRHNQLLDDVLPKLQGHKLVKQIYLFGSCARKEEEWASDVDLLLIVDDKATDREIRLLSHECYPDDFSVPELDIVVYRESSMSSRNFFLQQVQKEDAGRPDDNREQDDRRSFEKGAPVILGLNANLVSTSC